MQSKEKTCVSKDEIDNILCFSPRIAKQVTTVIKYYNCQPEVYCSMPILKTKHNRKILSSYNNAFLGNEKISRQYPTLLASYQNYRYKMAEYWTLPHKPSALKLKFQDIVHFYFRECKFLFICTPHYI